MIDANEQEIQGIITLVRDTFKDDLLDFMEGFYFVGVTQEVMITFMTRIFMSLADNMPTVVEEAVKEFYEEINSNE